MHLSQPLHLYVNWGAYDELSDKVELTEELAMRELGECRRLRDLGVRFDGYVMDAFWYAPDGGYLTWRKPHWPEGPDRWLDACRAQSVTPGLWFSSNTLTHMAPFEAWSDSLDVDNHKMCLFHGSFLPDLLATMQRWYERGFRIFKTDFVNFHAAPQCVRDTLLPSEIYAANVRAWRAGLAALRSRCPEVVLIGYNGLEEAPTQAPTDRPFRKTVDPRWLDVYDSLYCGDPRPSDVPMMNFWRSMDLYSDHMVRVFYANGFPLERIDNMAFMIGDTSTCYWRKTHAWKGMLILFLARGGWVNTYYGNLEFLSDADAAWFAKVQALFIHLEKHARTRRFGGIPGQAKAYGYVAEDTDGRVYTVVNPAQCVTSVDQPGCSGGRVLFRDAGFAPELRDGRLTLGPEQMAVVGTGCYTTDEYDLGVQDDVVIPESIEPIAADVVQVDEKTVSATLRVPESGRIRVLTHQTDANGLSRRNSGGKPFTRPPAKELLRIEAAQHGRSVDVATTYDRETWSGMSWSAGEISTEGLDPGGPLTVRCETVERTTVRLSLCLYRVG